MILIAGATGNIGRALIDELLSNSTEGLRAVTRDPARAALPVDVEVVAGDLGVPDSFVSAFRGARAVFLPSGMGPDELVIEAARRAGVEHVVLVSSITVQTHPHLGPAARNAAVESALEASGIGWTILRPTQFASNALWWSDAIAAGRPIELAYPDALLPTIAPADIAAVARRALTEDGHHSARYALTGPELISAREQISMISESVGRDIQIREVSRDHAFGAMAADVGEDVAGAILDVTGGDLNEGLQRIRDTVFRVTGEGAHPFRCWMEQNAAAFC